MYAILTYAMSFTGEVSIENITTMNALISWVIPRFTQAEEYYIQYGTEETLLDMETESIPSPMDTMLMNQMYSTSLIGLRPSTTYYFRVIAVFDEFVARYSQILSFRTYDEGKRLEYCGACILYSFIFCRTSHLSAIPEPY